MRQHMQLDQSDIEEFKSIYEREFGEQIEWLEAERLAGDLLRLYEAIWRHKLKQLSANCQDCPSAHTDQQAS